VLHSLRYLHVGVSEPSPGVPQYMILGFVDGIPFVRYDSERGRVEPQVPWMAAGAEPGYWDAQTQRSKGNQHGWDTIPRVSMNPIPPSPPGLHTVQRVLGCDLLADGSVRGIYRDGYDGWDFISFDSASRSFVAADGAAQVTKRKWEDDGTVAEHWTGYLEHTCPEWLRKYVGYGQEALERK
ncbi:1A04 protein, partial [Smithornis capensis]|nr:1A04 protein [Smithornis capensis]